MPPIPRVTSKSTRPASSEARRASPSTPAAPSVQTLSRRLLALRGAEPPLSAEAKKSLASLSSTERRMYSATLDALEAFSRGELTPARYMVRVMRSAAEISGGDRGRFVSLVHLAFNESDHQGYGMQVKRRVVGGGFHPAGAELERLNKRLAGERNTPAGGFSPHIVDSQSAASTVTHHFAELFKVGYTLGSRAGKVITEKVDEKSVNPGDVRNGYFAAMLGGGLRAGKITPEQAVKLLEWAYLQPPSMAPTPFQTRPDSFLDRGDFKLSQWAHALEQASGDFDYAPPPLWKRLGSMI